MNKGLFLAALISTFCSFPAFASDADQCKLLALQLLPPGAVLLGTTVAPAKPDSLQLAHRYNGDRERMGFNCFWYYVGLQVNLYGSKATIPLMCASNALGAYAFVKVMTRAETVLQ